MATISDPVQHIQGDSFNNYAFDVIDVSTNQTFLTDSVAHVRLTEVDADNIGIVFTLDSSANSTQVIKSVIQSGSNYTLRINLNIPGATMNLPHGDYYLKLWVSYPDGSIKTYDYFKLVVGNG